MELTALHGRLRASSNQLRVTFDLTQHLQRATRLYLDYLSNTEVMGSVDYLSYGFAIVVLSGGAMGFFKAGKECKCGGAL